MLVCITMSSCVTSAQAQIDTINDDVDVSMVITYGTPYYTVDGLLLYYIYKNMYYYPYYHRNRFYMHRYYRPLPRYNIGRYKPLNRDFYKHHYYKRPQYNNSNNNRFSFGNGSKGRLNKGTTSSRFGGRR